ncbi:MAG: hypothetical protein C4523_14920 [Myxococcales bacterium]|nr:MAG: hypothetical protein C4523_14920 [Myxococcales bacterium]
MSKRLEWTILGTALLLGVLGGVLGAKVHSALFWACWLPSLGGVGYLFRRNGKSRPASSETDRTPSEPPA